MSAHTCHALGCSKGCPARMLMCRSHWAQVPYEIQAEVYRTVALRGPSCDRSWAAWWRAQGRAVAFVAALEGRPSVAFLARELAFADTLEKKPC